LDAAAFLAPSGRGTPPARQEWWAAWTKMIAGGIILWGLVRWLPSEQAYLIGWVGMIGFIFLLHFGLFHLLSCLWRSLGVEARPLMQAPLLAVSVSEFWGRRWNTAFRDLTHRFLFRPLSAKIGVQGAFCTGFVISGLVHDLVISVPAGGGYGGPTLYFLLQAGAIFAERSRLGRRLGLGHGWRGWLFTAFTLAAPACLLFHPPFVQEVILPFLRVLGALP
jgi:hypothetical protein